MSILGIFGIDFKPIGKNQPINKSRASLLSIIALGEQHDSNEDVKGKDVLANLAKEVALFQVLLQRLLLHGLQSHQYMCVLQLRGAWRYINNVKTSY